MSAHKFIFNDRTLCFHLLATPARILGALALMAVAGCASVPPGRITADRMDYGQVIADSWKRQTLLNVVRLRYAEPECILKYMRIPSIAGTRGSERSRFFHKL